jgi:hypothetical protein
MEVTAIQNVRKFIVTATSTPRQYKVEIATLGKRGLKGKSAFETAKEAGYLGTEEEFALLLVSIQNKENKLNSVTSVNFFLEENISKLHA